MTVKILGSGLEGAATKASGTASHAEGKATEATGANSHAEGSLTQATSTGAHAEGVGCQAQGYASHAEGSSTVAGSFYAHAEGSQSSATADSSHAGGARAIADAVGAWSRSSGAATNIGGTRAQVSIYTMGLSTATTGGTQVTFDGAPTLTLTGTTRNVLVVPPYANYWFELTFSARRLGGTVSSQGWLMRGLIARDGPGTTARFVGTPTQDITGADITLGTVAISMTATNFLQVMVTPVANNTTVWHGVLTVNELVLTS